MTTRRPAGWCISASGTVSAFIVAHLHGPSRTPRRNSPSDRSFRLRLRRSWPSRRPALTRSPGTAGAAPWPG